MQSLLSVIDVGLVKLDGDAERTQHACCPLTDLCTKCLMLECQRLGPNGHGCQHDNDAEFYLRVIMAIVRARPPAGCFVQADSDKPTIPATKTSANRSYNVKGYTYSSLSARVHLGGGCADLVAGRDSTPKPHC